MKIAKIIMSVLTGVMLTFAPASVFALGNDVSVTNSGNNANVTSTSNQTSNTNVNNTNTATVTQSVTTSANTGNNTASHNIGATSINTGSALTNVALSTLANSNTTAISGPGVSGNNVINAVNTGNQLKVNTTTNTNSSVNVNNTNQATVDQMLNAVSNTGKNTANSNIGGAQITTGNSTINTQLGAGVNNNKTVVIDPMMDPTLPANQVDLTNTGDKANIKSTNNFNSNTNVNNMNMAYIDQSAYVKSNSGFNKANSNIGGSTIGTGNSMVNFLMQADANNNLTGIAEVTPWSMGNNMQDLVNTGDHLYVNTLVNDNSNMNVNNTNEFSLDQMVLSHSSSGHNNSSSNIGSGTQINTSGAGLNSSLMASGNSNNSLIGNLLDSLIAFLNQ